MSADGVSKSLMAFRQMTLEAVGFDSARAAKLAPDLKGKLRTEVSVEALALAREKGVYKEPEPVEDNGPTDPGEMARKHGRRTRCDYVQPAAEAGDGQGDGPEGPRELSRRHGRRFRR